MDIYPHEHRRGRVGIEFADETELVAVQDLLMTVPERRDDQRYAGQLDTYRRINGEFPYTTTMTVEQLGSLASKAAERANHIERIGSVIASEIHLPDDWPHHGLYKQIDRRGRELDVPTPA